MVLAKQAKAPREVVRATSELGLPKHFDQNNPDHIRKLNLVCQDTIDATICVDPSTGNVTVEPKIKKHADPDKVQACKVLVNKISDRIIEGAPTEWKISPSIFKKYDEEE